MENLVGKTWDTEEEFQLDIMCQLEGTVEFGSKQSVPFSSATQQEVYTDEESHILEYLQDEDGAVELLAVY